MSAMSSAATQPAMSAGQHGAKRMPSIIGTGVYTSVSLVARVLAILLVVLGILSLSGLTGLGGLVGLITRQGISQGD
ncbi:MAG: hypothetical protein E6J11_11760 [Chloroflexi bacterium]|nr:MAG: hypothetical protein E6J11_11760 [Chloroflexota bacterium]